MSNDRFNYEEAELDIIDSGGDPDYLDYRRPEKRDKYLRDLGLNLISYLPSRNSSASEIKHEEKRGYFDFIFHNLISNDQPISTSDSTYESDFSEIEESEEVFDEEEIIEEEDSGPYMNLSGTFIDDYDMDELVNIGYNRDDIELMSDDELKEAMEDAGIDTDMYDF